MLILVAVVAHIRLRSARFGIVVVAYLPEGERKMSRAFPLTVLLPIGSIACGTLANSSTLRLTSPGDMFAAIAQTCPPTSTQEEHLLFQC